MPGLTHWCCEACGAVLGVCSPRQLRLRGRDVDLGGGVAVVRCPVCGDCRIWEMARRPAMVHSSQLHDDSAGASPGR